MLTELTTQLKNIEETDLSKCDKLANILDKAKVEEIVNSRLKVDRVTLLYRYNAFYICLELYIYSVTSVNIWQHKFDYLYSLKFRASLALFILWLIYPVESLSAGTGIISESI